MSAAADRVTNLHEMLDHLLELDEFHFRDLHADPFRALVLRDIKTIKARLPAPKSVAEQMRESVDRLAGELAEEAWQLDKALGDLRVRFEAALRSRAYEAIPTKADGGPDHTGFVLAAFDDVLDAMAQEGPPGPAGPPAACATPTGPTGEERQANPGQVREAAGILHELLTAPSNTFLSDVASPEQVNALSMLKIWLKVLADQLEEEDVVVVRANPSHSPEPSIDRTGTAPSTLPDLERRIARLEKLVLGVGAPTLLGDPKTCGFCTHGAHTGMCGAPLDRGSTPATCCCMAL